MGAAGAGSTEKIYVEDVFSTWLYTGNSSTQTITNGIDLAGKGGLVWAKCRALDRPHQLYDTDRGAGNYLRTNTTQGQNLESTSLTSFNSNGFSLGTSINVNNLSETFASWTFRKAPKFFDVVTYTGNGVVGGRAVAHSLGSIPGFIIIKRIDSTGGDWFCSHRDLTNFGQHLFLNHPTGASSNFQWIANVTSTQFQVYNIDVLNDTGVTYVAYLFAHDAGGFGDSGNESVVSCGSFTTDASGNATVTLGWEPQWMLIKRSDGLNSWWLCDVMRGLSQTSFSYLAANTPTAEQTYGAGAIKLNPTGCSLSGFWPANASHVYIAIRRGPMRTPTDATKVFAMDTVNGTAPNPPALNSGFPVDLGFYKGKVVGADWAWADRLRGAVQLSSASTAVEASNSENKFDYMDGWNTNTNVLPNYPGWMFRRAPGFFDVVAYAGNYTANRQITHGLAVKPQLIIVKERNYGAYGWGVYAEPLSATKNLILNTDAGAVTSSNLWNNTEPTATVFTVDGPGGNNLVNGGWNYIAYLFASCPGVSKVGSYTGTGGTLSIDCGFTNGARFVMIKRTDVGSTGDWYVWDTARGIIANNDPYLLLNSTAAEVTNTDYIDPLSSGFQISSTAPAAINESGGSYIYLAIA